jgi:CDP-6-deoxy-D-xylo-4-hexulose-3-dehydrase
MTSKIKYVGKIFKIPFPFTDLSTKKARPALAISEPDEYGDIEFLFITTNKMGTGRDNIEIPEDILPIDSVLHLSKRYLLNKSIIMKELGEVPLSFLDEVLRKLTLRHVSSFYQNIHLPKLTQPFVPGEFRINCAGRIYDDKEMASLVDSALDFWLTAGRFESDFVKEFSEILDVKHVITTNSGSSANLLALSCLTSPLLQERRLQPGDEVITVAAGFPTTINPIIQNQLVPVFVDVTIPSYNVDISQLELARSERTKAVILAHTLGNPFDLSAVMDFVKKYNLWLIEDCCDAVGSKYKGQNVGTFGDLATVSFYPAHHITMGEGGCVLTNNPLLDKLVKSFRDWGRDCWCDTGTDNTCGKRFNRQLGNLPYGYDHKYTYSHIGYNLKLTDMQAAIGVAQLKKLPSFIEIRRRNFQILYEGLKDLKDLEEFFILPDATPESEPSWFGFPIAVKSEAPFTRNQVIEYLEKNKIATRLLFGGNIVRQPVFCNSDVQYRVIGDLKNSDFVMNQVFWIGVYPGMTTEMIEFILESFKEFSISFGNKALSQ